MNTMKPEDDRTPAPSQNPPQDAASYGHIYNPPQQPGARPYTPPQTNTGSPATQQTQPAHQVAAANLARDQLNTAYVQQAAINPYDRTQENPRLVQQDAWRKYHSAWQDYYQKYYERYYIGQVDHARRTLEASVAAQANTQGNVKEDEPVTTEEAMYDLRSKLRTKVQNKAQAVRKSRHFVPILAAVVVMFVFLFLQYNRTFFAFVTAYATPSSAKPQSLIANPGSADAVSDTDRILIPKINVDIPVVWDADPTSTQSLNDAMDHGAAWFGIDKANSRPGQIGNSVYSAHSSNDWLDGGNYKFAFVNLPQLGKDDLVYIDYQGTRYTYTVTHTKVVKPTDVAALQDPVDKPIMTLITCVPIGTADERLLVFADQINPRPGDASERPAETSPAAGSTSMPSNSPSFIERVFGNGN